MRSAKDQPRNLTEKSNQPRSAGRPGSAGIGQVERTVQESEQWFKSLFEDSPIGIELYDATGHLVDVNRACLDIFGVLDVEEIRGFSLLDDPNVTDDAKGRLRKGETVRYEGPFDFEKVKEHGLYRTSKSGVIELYYLITPLRLKDGQPMSGYLLQVQDITDRKRAEEQHVRLAREQAARVEADAARQRIASILESITEAFFALDRHWRFTYVNGEAERLVQRSREELLGKIVWDEFPEAVGTVFETEYHRAMSEQVAVNFETFYTPLDTWFEVRAYPSPDGLSVHFRDIGKRKQAEEALRESEQLLKETQAISRVGGWEYNVDNGRITWTDEVYRIYGVNSDHDPSDIADDISFYSKKDQQTIELAFKNAVDKGQPYDLELRLHAGDGGHKWVRTIGRPVFEGGKIRKVVGNIVDITDRKAAEAMREELLAEIQRRAAELDVTITAIADGIAISDLEGRIVRMNPAAERILGYSPKESRLVLEERAKLVRLETPDGRPFPVDKIPATRALAGETTYGVVMLIHHVGTGEAVWVSNSSAPIRTPDGTILGTVTVFTDITAIHELQDQREDLIRMVSHDLRNPLTIIQGQAQIIKRHADRVETVRKSADAICVSSQRINKMIQDLVDSARLQAGQMRLAQQPVDLTGFVADLLERAKGIKEIGRVNIEIAHDLPPAYADPDRLERVLMNLLTNAMKYSAPETPILIRAAQRDSELTVSVSDRGIGIQPKDLPHVFERFYRARGASKAEGLGLGLYITRMLVEAHGGRIWAESKPGEGSTFFFTLPLAQPGQSG